MFKFLFLIIFFIASNVSYAKSIISNNKSFKLKEVDFSDLNGWKNEDLLIPLKSFLKSCNHNAKNNSNKVISTELYNIKIKDLRNVCDIASVVAGATGNDARAFFENWFTPFLVVDKEDGKNGLFTGYYEISINGSREKDDVYKYPIYRRPDDLTDIPYYTREEIENGILKDKGYEIFYTDSKVDLAFLQIQGSGILKLTDGTQIKLAFDGKNNRDYTSIGKILVDKKYLKKKKVNAISIKDWFKNNSDKVDEILNKNESYIFFKERQDDYIRGAHGSILTPYRSIAVDYRMMPYGFPFWVETKVEDNKKVSKFKQLVISQDTGSAIKGAVRADIFFGSDSRAEKLASKMNFKGQYFILLPNNIVKNIYSIKK